MSIGRFSRRQGPVSLTRVCATAVAIGALITVGGALLGRDLPPSSPGSGSVREEPEQPGGPGGGAAGSGDDATDSEVADPPDVGYWTDERMRAAAPAPMPTEP